MSNAAKAKDKTSRRGHLRERHRRRRTGTEALDGVGRRGIRQSLDSQKRIYSALLLDPAMGDGGQRQRGGCATPPSKRPAEKYYLRWVEDSGAYASEPSLLDRHLLQVCHKPRLLELIHEFVMFDAGTRSCAVRTSISVSKAAHKTSSAVARAASFGTHRAAASR